MNFVQALNQVQKFRPGSENNFRSKNEAHSAAASPKSHSLNNFRSVAECGSVDKSYSFNERASENNFRSEIEAPSSQ